MSVIFFFLILFTSIFVILVENPVQSVLFLILSFLNSSLLLFIIGIEFISFIFVIVYVGAIAVLFLFVIMMLNIGPIETFSKKFFISKRFFFTLIFFISLFYIFNNFLIYFYLNLDFFYNFNSWIVLVHWNDLFFLKSDIFGLGLLLYNVYFFPFILSGFLLLISMVGTIVLTLDSFLNFQKIEELRTKKQIISLQIYRINKVFFK
jgi:NADH-quinone oxidoreductase subunit J